MKTHSNPTSNPEPGLSFDPNNRSLNILLVSDIHNGFEQLKHLKTWYDHNPQKFDYVFGLGDFDSFHPVPDQPFNEKHNDFTDITKILKDLEYFSAPIIYIPGNHDPITLHKEDPKLTDRSILAQNRCLVIADKLQVVGFGGSLPGYWEKDNKFEVNRDSYPYSDDEGFGGDLRKLLEKYCNEENQTLLLTHTGPFTSSTTLIYREHEDRNLWLGSKDMEKMLKGGNKYNILADIHGHSHPSVGRANIGKVQIINPGAMVVRNFGILNLQRSSVNDKWIVKKLEFIDLNAYPEFVAM